MLNNKKQFILIAASIYFLIQLLVPAYMIFEQQQTLTKGTLYKFKVRPIDPYDPFRGRYVVLSFLASVDSVPVDEKDKPRLIEFPLAYNDWAYVTLDVDKNGYAKLGNITIEEPIATSLDYLRVQVNSSYYEDSYRVRLPFDRFYAPEDKAYAIETTVRNRSRRNKEQDVYVAVKVRHGKGTIEDLFIKDTPVLKFLEAQADNKSKP